MRADYARALSRLFKMIRARQATEDIRTLYMFVYPMIYAAIRRGDIRMTCTAPLSVSMVRRLEHDGFLVISDGQGKTLISWVDISGISDLGEPSGPPPDEPAFKEPNLQSLLAADGFNLPDPSYP